MARDGGEEFILSAAAERGKEMQGEGLHASLFFTLMTSGRTVKSHLFQRQDL